MLVCISTIINVINFKLFLFVVFCFFFFFFFSSRRRHTRFDCDWSSDVCSSDLEEIERRGRLADAIVMAHPSLTDIDESASIDAALFGTGRPVIMAPATAGKIGRASCRERV